MPQLYEVPLPWYRYSYYRSVELYRYRYWAGIYDISEICTMSASISDKYLEITKCGIVREIAESPTVSGSVHLPNLSSLGDRPEIWPENPSVGGGWAAEP